MRKTRGLLRIGALTLEWGRRTYMMGVLNVTPDSFSGDGVMGLAAAVARGGQVLTEGADMIDLGGESTRPGAQPVPLEEEAHRVIPVVEALVHKFDAVVSVDTMKAEVARQALASGAAMINDVSALRADPAMAAVVAAHNARVVLMHGYQGTAAPASRSSVGDIMAEVIEFLHERIAFAVAAGIPREHILADPGFGFGKTVEQNLELLRRLGELRSLEQPVLIGPSRKGTIGRVLGGLPVQERLEGTAAAVAVAILHGADVLRVHDVRAMVRVARMTDAIARPTVPWRRALTGEGEMRDTRMLVLIGMLAGAAFILMATVQVPVLPAAPYLRYDPSDVVALLMAFVAGPVPGVAVVALKDVLYLLFRARSIFGPLANLLAVATFVGVAGWVYHRRPNPSWPWLVASCAAGALARILVMIPGNFVILNLQFGLAPARVAALLWPVIIPFNACSAHRALLCA